MKLERLSNGNLLIKKDDDTIQKVLIGDFHAVRHRTQQAVILTKTPSSQPDAGDGVTLFPADISDPVVADVDALMIELSTNLMFHGSVGAGGASGINTVAFEDESTVAVDETVDVLLAANASRKGAIITNDEEGETVYIGFGDDPTAKLSFALVSGASLILDADLNTTQEIRGICDAGLTSNIQIQEGL